jgi:hypothetical protein
MVRKRTGGIKSNVLIFINLVEKSSYVIPIPTQPPLTLRGGVEGLMEKHISL